MTRNVAHFELLNTKPFRSRCRVSWLTQHGKDVFLDRDCRRDESRNPSPRVVSSRRGVIRRRDTSHRGSGWNSNGSPALAVPKRSVEHRVPSQTLDLHCHCSGKLRRRVFRISVQTFERLAETPVAAFGLNHHYQGMLKHGRDPFVGLLTALQLHQFDVRNVALERSQSPLMVGTDVWNEERRSQSICLKTPARAPPSRQTLITELNSQSRVSLI
jgi:hypothetical protein